LRSPAIIAWSLGLARHPGRPSKPAHKPPAAPKPGGVAPEPANARRRARLDGGGVHFPVTSETRRKVRPLTVARGPGRDRAPPAPLPSPPHYPPARESGPRASPFLAKGCAKCPISKRTERWRRNACVLPTRCAVRVSVSSCSALLVFTWRLPITSIASTNTARRTAACKTDRQRESRRAREAHFLHRRQCARHPVTHATAVRTPGSFTLAGSEEPGPFLASIGSARGSRTIVTVRRPGLPRTPFQRSGRQDIRRRPAFQRPRHEGGRSHDRH
jgi:hypothetical protein